MKSSIYEPHIIRDPLLPFTFHPDNLYPAHASVLNWHTPIEILRAVSGSGVVLCGTRTFAFAKDDLFVVNSGELHQIKATDEAVSYDVLILDGKFCAENGIPIEKTRFCETIRDARMRSLYDEVGKALADTGVCRAAKTRKAVLGLLIGLRENYTAATDSDGDTRDSAGLEHVKNTMTYIRCHLEEALTLDDIAAAAGVSKYHLTRLFKSFTGQTVFEYLNIVRCMEAKRRMADGMTVSQAATSCGFGNLSYFTRTYKHHVGELPSKSRQG